jgi:ATP-dependent protease ClpP protease subunit
MMGSYGELQDRMKWLEMTQDRILDIFAERSSNVTGKSFAATRKYIKQNWSRTDWWISSDEALKQGFVDEIR